jgi:hypothetical protein
MKRIDVFQTECTANAAGDFAAGARVDVECTVNLLETSLRAKAHVHFTARYGTTKVVP